MVDKRLKNSLIIVGFGVALYAALMNLGPVIAFFKNLLSLALPLAIG